MITFFVLSVITLAIGIVALAALGIIGGVLATALVVIADIIIGSLPFVAIIYVIWWLLFKKKDKGDKKS